MLDDSQGSITRWIADLKQGDLAAANGLWERYFTRMVDLARARLRIRAVETPAATRKTPH